MTYEAPERMVAAVGLVTEALEESGITMDADECIVVLAAVLAGTIETHPRFHEGPPMAFLERVIEIIRKVARERLM